MTTMPTSMEARPASQGATSRHMEAVAMQNGDVREAAVAEEVTNMVCSLGGFDASTVDRAAAFTDLGFDSLALAQLGSRIRKQLGVRVPLADMLEPTLTIDALARRLEPDVAASAVPEPAAMAADATPPPASQVVAPAASAPAVESTGGNGHGGLLPANTVEALILEQLQLMERQLEVLALLAGRRIDAGPEG